jgi:hypothetical protein
MITFLIDLFGFLRAFFPSRYNLSARLVAFPRVGGLHHRYDWQQAA